MRRRSTSATIGLAVAVALAACSTDGHVIAIRSDEVTTPSDGDAPVSLPDAVPDNGPDNGPDNLPDAEPPPTDETTDPPTTKPSTTAPNRPPDEPDPPGGLLPAGDGAGDPLFPDLGNPGIDVVDYDVQLTYDNDADALAGSVTLTVEPTQDRSEFTLDSIGPKVSRITVDGAEADFEADDPELRVTPPVPLERGRQVVVRVEYTVVPKLLEGADLPSGWFNSGDGSYVLNEPDGARSWLPSNDHPSDKATWTFAITVDAGITAVANGALVSSTDGPAGTTWVWRQNDPMATYLILLITGQYELVEGTGPAGLPLLSAVMRGDRATMQPYLDSIDDQIDFFDDYFGPYPLDHYGLAITDSFPGLAMETQGRSLFSRDDLNGEVGDLQELLLSHELAHQWYGDGVTLIEWQDIWLNESFATYAQWMWLDHIGLRDLETEASYALEARQQLPGSPTGTPKVDELFGFNSYDGGAVVLHALRRTIGDDGFFVVMKRWAAENVGTSRSTEDFIALASEVAATDLTSFFDTWLYSDPPPPKYP